MCHLQSDMKTFLSRNTLSLSKETQWWDSAGAAEICVECSFTFLQWESRHFYPKQRITETSCIQLSSRGLQALLQCRPTKIKASIWQFCQSQGSAVRVWTDRMGTRSCCGPHLPSNTFLNHCRIRAYLIICSLSLSLLLHVLLIHFSCCDSSHPPDLPDSPCCSTPALFLLLLRLERSALVTHLLQLWIILHRYPEDCTSR